MMKRTLAIKLCIFAALAIAVVFTVGNAKWWRNRINMRWGYWKTNIDEFGDTINQEFQEVPLAKDESIPKLIAAYFNGREGWTKIPAKA